MRCMTNRVWMLALAVGACTPEPVVDLAPDPGRLGLDGSTGPYGVAHQQVRAQARVADAVHYDVFWPSDGSAEYASDAADCPVVAFIHGGLVAADQYRWLAIHMASRGYCVLMPEHHLQLAIAESDNASIALDDLLERPIAVLDGHVASRASVMGHSLGGAVGAFRWVADERFEGLALLASWPADGTDVEAMAGRPSLSIIGSEDDGGEAPVTAYEQSQRFAEPHWFGVIDGMNHYDWVDGATDANLRGDGVPTRPQEQTRRAALRVVDTWLDATLRDDAPAQQRLDNRDFPGISEAP